MLHSAFHRGPTCDERCCSPGGADNQSRKAHAGEVAAGDQGSGVACRFQGFRRCGDLGNTLCAEPQAHAAEVEQVLRSPGADVQARAKQFDGRRSSRRLRRAVSHLSSQGVVSGHLFLSDAGFRTAVNELLPNPFRLAGAVAQPNPGDYQIVFAVVSNEPGEKLTLPFFSRLTSSTTAKRF